MATQLLGQIYLLDPTKIPPWFRQNKLSSKNRLENPLGVGEKNDKINLTIKRVTTLGAPNAQIIFKKTLFIQYKQFLLADKFRQYLEGFKDGNSKYSHWKCTKCSQLCKILPLTFKVVTDNSIG